LTSPGDKLLRVAALVLDRGHPTLFKRLSLLGEHIARSDRTDTDELLDEGLQDERSDEPPTEVVDGDGDGDEDAPDSDDEDDEDHDEEEDDDVEGFSGFPMGALPQKERRQGPHPKDVSVGKPDWWNPR